LWVATHSGGLCRFNRHSGNFVIYCHSRRPPRQPLGGHQQWRPEPVRSPAEKICGISR
jgi:hypothetical protein